jgi:hypothetical protein
MPVAMPLQVMPLQVASSVRSFCLYQSILKYSTVSAQHNIINCRIKSSPSGYQGTSSSPARTGVNATFGSRIGVIWIFDKMAICVALAQLKYAGWTGYGTAFMIIRPSY